MDKNRLKAIHMLRESRRMTVDAASGLSHEQLSLIPPGYSNNVLWNLGHVVVTQQLLCYKIAGLDMYVSDAFVEALEKGSSPANWADPPDLDLVLTLAQELPDRFEADCRSERFVHYQEYTTSRGVKLGDIDDAILFNNIHEGIHMGIIMSLRKTLK